MICEVRATLNEKKQNHQARTVGIMMLLTLLGKVLGLVRDMMLGRNFATGFEANAFLAASRIPRNFFDAIFASAISASFIPVFNEYLENRGKEEAFRLSDAFLTVVALLTVVLSALGMLFAEPLTAFLADGFDAQTAKLCAELLRLLFPTVFFTGVAFSFVGVLQSLGEFNIPALLSAVSNAVIILYYVLFCRQYGVVGLAVAFLIGWALQALIQVPFLHRFGYRYRPALRHEGMKKIFALVLPVLVSTWVQPLNLTVATKYASRLNGGAATSALEYANTLYTIVAGVFVLSVANVVFPELSRISARNDAQEFGRSISETLQTTLFFITPMAIGLAVMAKPIVRLLYEWGAWTSESTELTAGALTYLSLGIVGYGAQILLSRAYYAHQEGKTPLVAGIVSVLVNAALCALFSEQFGIRALAVAGAAGMIFPALVMLFSLAKRYPVLLSWDESILPFFKMLFSSLAMGAGAYWVSRICKGVLGDGIVGRAVDVLLPVAVGVVIYFVLTLLLRLPVMEQVKELLHRKKGEEA